MGNTSKDQPGRAQPNESENQPGYEPEEEKSRRGAQRQSQGAPDDLSQRRGFDDRRKDEVSSPPPGGVDPDLDASGEEQVERRKDAGGRGDERGPRKS